VPRLLNGVGVRFDVVVFQFFHVWGDGYPYDRAHDTVAKAWKQAGVDVLDLCDAYRGIAASELAINRLDAHPSARAHGIAARSTLDRFFGLSGDRPVRKATGTTTPPRA
jgi:hypothetical protein